MEPSQITAAADRLIALRHGRDRLDRLPDALRPRSVADGYAIQEALRRRRVAAGEGPYAGFKIGCTTAVMQAYLKIPEPCAGGILAADLMESGAVFDGSARRLGVECEIAVRLATPLGGDGAPSMAQAMGAVGAVMAAIEVVEDRYVDWTTLDAPTLIADDFFQRACVLGPPMPNWRDHDLRDLEGRMTIDGGAPLTGSGRDILGHPLEALRWLAGRRPLPAGAVVMLGSVVRTQWLDPGSHVAIDLGGLSAASTSLRTAEADSSAPGP